MGNIRLKPINEQVVALLGASSGMGRSAAKKIAVRGAKVVVAARGEEGLKSLVEEIRADGGTAEYIVADASDFEQVKRVADFAAEKFGRLDTWVGAAGVWVTAKFEETKPEEFKRILDVNLLGQAHGIWAALPHLKKNAENGGTGGAIILFASVLGQIGLPLTSAYCSSKHGVVGLADSVRIEFLQNNLPISLTTILPWGTNTPIYNTGLSRIGFMPRPSAPIIQPEVVADAVLYAAENPVRQIYGSGQAKALALANQMMPETMDAVFAFASTADAQSTKFPRDENSPEGLFAPVSDYWIHGEFDDESLDFSPYVALQTGQTPADSLSEIDAALEMLANAPPVLTGRYDFAAIQPILRGIIERQAKNELAANQTNA